MPTTATRSAAACGRYARVGASVGGLAARLAGERYLGWSARSRQACVGAEGGAGRPEGPADEGGADASPPSPTRCRRNMPASWPSCRPTRRPWAGPSCAAAWRPSSGPTGRRSSQSSTRRPRSPPRWARCTARRCPTAREVASKLQYPDMASAVEADLDQLKLVFAVGQRFDPAIRTDEIHAEITTRLREELDYRREARHVALYRHMLRDEPDVHVPEVVPSHSTDRLLTMNWLEGEPLLNWKSRSQEERDRARRQHVPRLVRAVLCLRRDPRRPASRQLHGAARRLGQPAGFRLRARSSRRASCAARSSSIAR